MNHRPRRRQLSVILAVTLAVTAAFGYAFVNYRHSGSARAPGQAGGRGPASAAGTPEPAAPRPSSTPATSTPRAPATAEAVLYLLTELLPAGTTSGFATFANRDLLVAEVRYTRGNATNAVRAVVTVTPPSAVPSEGPSCNATKPADCAVLPNYATIRLSRGADCHQAMLARVDHTDHTEVIVELDNCPHITRPAASTPHPAPEANTLSAAEIQLIAADDQWGRTMPAEFIRGGRARFATAPKVRNPLRPRSVP